MENYIYYRTTKGNIVDQFDIAKAAEIFNGVMFNTPNTLTVREYAVYCKGLAEEIKDPTPEMFLPISKVKAVQLYQRQHPEKSFSECKDYIDDLAEKSNT